MTQALEVKETKAQRAERLKREKNPWQAFDEVRAFARAGRSSVVPEWASTYFKWWGIYTQGDGVGVTGGKGGEGLVTDYFMMRIGIPNGIVSASQLRVIGGLTRKYARNLADITVRQNIQLHWLTIESLPEVVDALDAIGLSPKGACGDVVRNVTGCPLAGIAADELIDASPLAIEISDELKANPEFYNRLSLLVFLSRDQRHWPYRDKAQRRSRLLAARWRRPFHRSAYRRSPGCLHRASPGSPRGPHCN